MGQSKEELIKALEKIDKEICSFKENEYDKLGQFSSTLDDVLFELPDEEIDLIPLLQLISEGLQAVSKNETDNSQQVIELFISGLKLLVLLLQKENDKKSELLNEAGYNLWKALGRDLSKCPYKPEKMAGADSETYNLNDIAAGLVHLDLDDLGAVLKIHELLISFIDNYKVSDSIKQNIEEAAKILYTIVEKTIDDIDSAFDKVSELIEEVANEFEEIDMKKIKIETKQIVEEKEPPIEPEIVEKTPVQTPQPEPEKKPVVNKNPATLPVVNDLNDDGSEKFDLLPEDADADMLGEYVTESLEYLEGAEEGLLTLESNPEEADAINIVFRAFHTIKGTSAFLGLDLITELSHNAENMFSRMRDGEIQCKGGYADLALQSVDTLKAVINLVPVALQSGKVNKPAGTNNLVRLLTDPEAAGISAETGVNLDTSKKEAEVDNSEIEIVPEISTNASPKLKQAVKQPPASTAKTSQESSVRVRTDRLDNLIDMVGELVIAQSMVGEDDTIIKVENHELLRKVMHSGKIVRELQDLTMSMRMVPLKPTFHKINRLVRDLARKSNKMIELITEGEDTEIDRNMVAAINDPLVHMIRNAVDHGIEGPEDRTKNNKSAKGVVKLAAYHSGGNVVVEIQDDGKGLNRSKILDKAISNGLIESGQSMSDSEVFNLVFEPGFSTAEKVTDISGRGVGMDVVRRGVEELRGRIDITSEVGKGSTFALRLPLTLAITDGMLVKVGDQRFIIPTINIYISFRPEKESLSTVAGRGEMVMLRGDLMPIFRIHRLFGVKNAIEDSTEGLLVIIDDGDRRYALLVDELLGQHQVVAKSLGESIGKIQGVSGGAILGDGRVGLILDTAEVVALGKQS